MQIVVRGDAGTLLHTYLRIRQGRELESLKERLRSEVTSSPTLFTHIFADDSFSFHVIVLRYYRHVIKILGQSREGFVLQNRNSVYYSLLLR